MIFNRTKQDVDDAIKIRAEKVQKGLELTEEDAEILEKGTMTIKTLNRIEEKQDMLKLLINDMGYWNTPISNKVWVETDIFTDADFRRIVNNLKMLREAFFVYSNTPKTPNETYHFETINSIEKILNDLDIMINDVKSHYRNCGTFNCGEKL